MWRRSTLGTAAAFLFMAIAVASAGDDRPRHRPVVAGEMVVNPYDIIAVYRPAGQQTVALYLGRPGQDIQVVFFHDARMAANIFSDLWNNNDITKDPGADDAKPLTRMLIAGTQGTTATLIANADRIMAVVREPNHQFVRIFFDKPNAVVPVAEPGAGTGPSDKNYLEIQNIRDEADAVMAAYKACLCNQ
jgi:hypothetical protein